LGRAGDFTLGAEARSGVREDDFVVTSCDASTDVGPCEVNGFFIKLFNGFILDGDLSGERSHRGLFSTGITTVVKISGDRVSITREILGRVSSGPDYISDCEVERCFVENGHANFTELIP